MIMLSNLLLSEKRFIQVESYVPVRPNRGCFEAVIEIILTIQKFLVISRHFRVVFVKRILP